MHPRDVRTELPPRGPFPRALWSVSIAPPRSDSFSPPPHTEQGCAADGVRVDAHARHPRPPSDSNLSERRMHPRDVCAELARRGEGPASGFAVSVSGCGVSGDTALCRMTKVTLHTSRLLYGDIRTARAGSPDLHSQRLHSHAHDRVWREHQRGPPAEVMSPVRTQLPRRGVRPAFGLAVSAGFQKSTPPPNRQLVVHYY